MSTPLPPPGQAPTPTASAASKSVAPARRALDPEESAVAAALQALPVSEPSPELDARVLAMARSALAADAAHRQRPAAAARTRRSPRALWWLGSAAGAVMAAGIGWQLGGDSHQAERARAESAAGDARHSAAAPASDDSAEFEVLIIPRASTTAEDIQTEKAAGARESSPPPATEMARMAAPAPPPPALQETAPPMSTAPAPAAPAPSEPQPGAAPSQAAGSRSNLAERVQSSPAPGEPSLDQVVVTGARISPADFPPVAQDFRLKPEDWLQRIRERRDSGDTDSARRSLLDFMRAHPQRVVPRDLRTLLNEAP